MLIIHYLKALIYYDIIQTVFSTNSVSQTKHVRRYTVDSVNNCRSGIATAGTQEEEMSRYHTVLDYYNRLVYIISFKRRQRKKSK